MLYKNYMNGLMQALQKKHLGTEHSLERGVTTWLFAFNELSTHDFVPGSYSNSLR